MPGATARSVGRASARCASISARCSGVRRSGSGLGGMEFIAVLRLVDDPNLVRGLHQSRAGCEDGLA